MTSLVMSSPRRDNVSASLALAFTVAVAPPLCALLRLGVEYRLDASSTLAIVMLAPWWITTPLGLVSGRWDISRRTALASALLPFGYVATVWLASVAAGRGHLGGVSSVDEAWRLCGIVALWTIVLVLEGLLLGFWLLLPLVPWMTVLRRMRLTPTGDAPAAMFFVAGSSALVESTVLAVVDRSTAWWMLGTALMGAAAVGSAMMDWQARIAKVRGYGHVDVPSQPQLSMEVPLRLGSDVDDYEHLLISAHPPGGPQTYRHEPPERAMALVPRGAKISLKTVLWAWLTPMDKRAIFVLAVCNTILLVLCGGILALVKLFG